MSISHSIVVTISLSIAYNNLFLEAHHHVASNVDEGLVHIHILFGRCLVKLEEEKREFIFFLGKCLVKLVNQVNPTGKKGAFVLFILVCNFSYTRVSGVSDN
jgi:hypothetical protein